MPKSKISLEQDIIVCNYNWLVVSDFLETLKSLSRIEPSQQ